MTKKTEPGSYVVHSTTRLNGQKIPIQKDPKQRGYDQVFRPAISTDTLRKLDHADWLENFAKVMQLQTGVEMTPMRMGVISRCNLAAEYIKLLHHERDDLLKKLGEATRGQMEGSNSIGDRHTAGEGSQDGSKTSSDGRNH